MKKLNRQQAITEYIKLIKTRIEHPILKYNKGTTELHHILPRSLLNNIKIADVPTNKIRLYSREHLIAHYLLSIMFPDNIKIQTAFYLMAKGKQDSKNIYCMSVAYQKSRERIIKHRTGKTYTDLFGINKMIEIKRKQKVAKLDKAIRFLVDNNK